MIKASASGVLISAIAISGALAVGVFAVAPFNARARAAVGQTEIDIAAERIGGAFALLQQSNIVPAITPAATRASKGDLSRTRNCAGATWPNIDVSCLSRADGSPAPRVRTITIGYQAGESTTVLVHVPAAEVAQR